MERFANLFETLSKRLENDETFALRMRMAGEGKFKDFHGRNEIPALRAFLEHAEKLDVQDIAVRDAEARESVVSEML
ncbi:MAG: hypothetical protein HY579_00090 [Nitrospinae bacterium]|nr:hypothetical protein [Nitrospinota bacterium]